MSDDKKKRVSEITVLEFSNYVRPEIVEKRNHGWVLNGDHNSFYQYIIDRNNGSPTNSSVNKSYADLIWGRGIAPLNVSDESTEWKTFLEIFPEEEMRKVICDFQVFNELSFQTSPERGNRERLSKITHVPKQWVATGLANSKGKIDTYYLSRDWRRWRQQGFKPEPYPAFGTEPSAPAQFYVSHPYIVGKFYYGDPDYLAGLPYCEMEEEIANLNINSIKNGLSAGYIINVPGGISLSDEEKADFERAVKQKLTGSPNASRFVLSWNDLDVEITITPFPVNENIHKQWQFLTNESKQQILTSHRCPSPSIAGIISSSGFSNTADEMDTAEEQLVKRVIKPKQDFILGCFHEVLRAYNIDLELEFLPLTEAQEEIEEEEEEPETTELSSQMVDALIQLGEEVDDTWEIVDDSRCDEITLDEIQLNNVFELASVPVTPRKNSEQDTSLFKIRYRYAGSGEGEREFCNKVLKANKVYRAEDLDSNFNYNEDFAPSGKNTYNLFLYKGGVNCKHWWQRVIFLKKGNKRISVGDARKLILALDPKERKDARWQKNDPKVAQVAERKNNFWSLTPNYRQ